MTEENPARQCLAGGIREILIKSKKVTCQHGYVRHEKISVSLV